MLCVARAIIARSEISLLDNVNMLKYSSLTKKTKVVLPHPKSQNRKLQLAWKESKKDISDCNRVHCDTGKAGTLEGCGSQRERGE